MDPSSTYKIGFEKLTETQKSILEECFQKKSGGLSIPMGSGKTLVSILLALKLSPTEPMLVVVSKSILPSWELEIKKFFPEGELKYEVFHKEKLKDQTDRWIPNKMTQLILATPQILSKYYSEYQVSAKFEHLVYPDAFAPAIKHYERPGKPFLAHTCGGGYLFSRKWGVLIVDEAQCYTKPTNKQCMAIASLCATYRWMLSGTMFDEPSPERLLGYYLLLDWEGVPRNLPDFKTLLFGKDSRFSGLRQTLVFREENRDFKIPNVNKQIVSHNLSLNEQKLYLGMKEILKVLKNKVQEFKDREDHANTKRFSSYILAMVSYLREGLVCPLIPITSVAIDMADFKTKSELSHIWMEKIRDMNLNEWFKDADAMRSSRISKALEIVAAHKKDRVILFSCFRACLLAIEYYLKKEAKDRSLFTISGSMNLKKRGEIIEAFNTSENGILLLTYEVGANGLNLQASNTVLLLDFWWNSGKTSQAVARVLRYGQKAHTVNVYFFTSNTGIETILFKKQEMKLQVGNQLMDGSCVMKIPKLDMKRVLELITTNENTLMVQKINHIY